MNKIVFLSALIMLLGIYEEVDGSISKIRDYSDHSVPEDDSSSITSELDVSESVTTENVGEYYYNEDEMAEDYEDYVYKEPEITATEMPVEEELNCMMQYPSESTDEINHCCKVMDHNNAAIGLYTSEEIERCMLLHMKVVFDYDADVDVTDLVKLTRSSQRCPVADSIAFLEMLCCKKHPCERYEKNVLRSMCFNCIQLCPSCNGWIIH